MIFSNVDLASHDVYFKSADTVAATVIYEYDLRNWGQSPIKLQINM